MQDSAGNITYKHYIIAGSARVGVETIAVTSGGTTDTLSFFVQDQVGSVVAEVTEGLGGLNQQLTVYSHDPWGKARPTSGAGANIALLPGISQPTSAVMAGQHEGFAGHEDLEDLGIVDMEGRVYDPETGRFLSPDPNVQYPDSSQGYNRYTYVNNNPLSLSDPTGFFSFGGYVVGGGDVLAGMYPEKYGQAVGTIGPIVGAFLNTIPFCQGWCDALVTAASQAQAGYLETGSIGEGIKDGVLAGAEAEIFATIGGDFGESPGSAALFERSLAEGLVGGAFATAGGGDFGDGFLGAFASSEAGPYISGMGKGPGQMIVAALIGGTASRLNGGNFATGAIQAALQNLFNEQGEKTLKQESEDDTVAVANRYDVPVDLASAVVQTESQFDLNAVNYNVNSGGIITSVDYGLMQVNSLNFGGVALGSDGKYFTIDPIKAIADPHYNLNVGMAILASDYRAALKVATSYQDAIRMTYARYNSGSWTNYATPGTAVYAHVQAFMKNYNRLSSTP